MRSQLDAIKRVNPRTNVEYWTARDLKEKLGYDTWENFHAALHRAMDSCMVSGEAVSRHFRETTKMIAAGNGASRQVVDYFLTKHAAHLIAMNGDPQKPEIAVAQMYFSIQTLKQEREEKMTDEDRRIALRQRVRTNNAQLSATAVESGVATNHLGFFHGAGYQGLYAGRDLATIKAQKGIPQSEDLLDRSGATELALNDFRITQTKDKIKREQVKGENAAIETHRAVGTEVRTAIAKIGGVMPEKLAPEASIKKLESARKKLAKLAAKESKLVSAPQTEY